MTDEEREVAKELRRIRDEVRQKASPEGEPAMELPPPPEVREPPAIPKEELPAPEVVLVTEIHYHPVLEEDYDDQHEFVELHNPGEAAISLMGSDEVFEAEPT